MNGYTLILDAFWVSNKSFPTIQPDVSEVGKIFHEYYSGPARYLGWMDLVLLKDIIKKNNITHIILQNLDTLGKIAQKTKTVKVCVAYEYHHFVFNSISPDKKLVHCKPIYTDAVFGGWESSPDDFEISIRAKSYMRYLLIHTHVDSITCLTNNVKVNARWNEAGHVVFDTEPN